MTKPSIVAIVGPTCVGKTALAMALADRFPVEIVSVDSRQVYRGMDIGTAKATPQEQARVPHHLINVVEPTEEFSLAAFLELAQVAINDIHAKGKLPLLVGGTGQYLWAILEAWRVPAVAPDLKYRREMAKLTPDMLFSQLEAVDPQAARTINLHNVRRLIRALEVHHLTGIAWSEMRRQWPAPYRALVIGLTMPRDQLYQRIDQRVDDMVRHGWTEEVRRLLDNGVTRKHSSMASVGYRELAAFLSGDIALEEAIQNIKIGTHRVARHQYAWFRLSDARLRWLEVGEEVEAEGTNLVRAFVEEVS